MSGLGDLTKLPPELLLKVYEDALQEPAKHVGKLSTDALKTARLLLLPLQLAGALQDRLQPMIDRIAKRVAEDRRISPPAEVVGPALEKMRYIPDASELWKMFEELLTKAMDSAEAPRVHPSFPHIIPQLSRDEAWILFRLRNHAFNVVDTLDWDKAENRFKNRKIESSELPTGDLLLPMQIDLYYSHLESMGLVQWPVLKQDPIVEGSVQTGVRRYSKMQLTSFGALFAEACIPRGGF